VSSEKVLKLTAGNKSGFKILFIVDNMPTQTAIIVELYQNMNVLLLPPDTTSLSLLL